MSQGVIRKLKEAGHQAFWVGGCVRDGLLGRSVKDRDVATSALPDEVLAIFPDARVVGPRFGIAAVRDGEDLVEIATFRRDCGYSDGRRPDRVTYTSDPRVDVLRRDFTVNAILHDPVSDSMHDYVGGERDLERRLIRAVGDPLVRFREDRLRMLRAVRFAASLDFEIEAATLSAIRECAPAIESVAAERIQLELTRILTEGGARRGFELLDRSGLLERLLPEVKALQGVEQPPEFHPEGDVWVHTMLMLDGLESPPATLAWGVLLHDVGKPDTLTRSDRIRFHGHVERGVELARRICSRLRFSNSDARQVVALVKNHMRFMAVRQMRPGKLRRFLEQPGFGEHLELHRVDCLSSHGKLANYEFAAERLRQLEAEKPLPRLLTGRDLIKEGHVPGPVFREILTEVEERQIEGEITGRDAALAYVRMRFPVSGS